MKSLSTLQISDTDEQITDADLLSSIAQGDETAVIALYDRYHRVLFGLIVRILHNHAESEDLLQEVFVQVWQKAQNFDQERGKAFTWLMTITHCRAIDRLRFLRTRTRTTEKVKASKPLYTDSKIEHNLILQNRQKMVRTALSQLPEKERELLLMAYFAGHTQQEIAEQTNIPLGTVKTRMRMGMMKLRETLNADSHIWL
ncbi:MAG: sigma-70 family RNA polymerase sigma factor [Acidobacteriota bacterium]|nr:sigma-70 family RNA polymerase sigma factor [Acidobacteriota bacterium]